VTRRRILVDVDGVLADFVGPVITWANGLRRAGEPPFTREGITEFDLLKAWGIAHMWGELDRHVIKPGFCEAIEPYPGAREFLDRLKLVADVVIVTSPWKSSPTWCFERRVWLEKRLGYTGPLVFTKEKHLIKGDMLIDDCAEHTDAFPGVGMLLDQPWNQNATRSLRVANYGQALDRLASIGMV
jgi:5'(3')-deoxyribonucleotidase